MSPTVAPMQQGRQITSGLGFLALRPMARRSRFR